LFAEINLVNFRGKTENKCVSKMRIDKSGITPPQFQGNIFFVDCMPLSGRGLRVYPYPRVNPIRPVTPGRVGCVPRSRRMAPMDRIHATSY